MIYTDTQPNCSSKTLTSSSIYCEFDVVSNLLTVYNVVDSTVPGGSIIEFEVDSFKNPYSGKPRSGFIVKTLDPLDGEIDSSTISKLTIEF